MMNLLVVDVEADIQNVPNYKHKSQLQSLNHTAWFHGISCVLGHQSSPDLNTVVSLV
jgi:acyl-CoA thioesterase